MSDGVKPQKISIGFLGGQVLGARVASDELAKLRAALGQRPEGPNSTATGWHDLTAEDGTVALDLAKVVYVLVDAEGPHVGFGS
ncbi:MAG TPA: hypothetical protein VKV21_16905 [Solirubrobacteraceae bacterium]|nr:hypothetical protein [Solirubrobacteraceae bacterium]